MVKIIFLKSVFLFILYTFKFTYMYLYNLCFFCYFKHMHLLIHKKFLSKTFQLQQKLCMDIL